MIFLKTFKSIKCSGLNFYYPKTLHNSVFVLLVAVFGPKLLSLKEKLYLLGTLSVLQVIIICGFHAHAARKGSIDVQ